MESTTNKKSIKGTRALITGASSGLGYAMAKALAHAGASVLLTARTADAVEKAAVQLQKSGCDAYGMILDVRSEESIEQVVAWVNKKWGHLDVLVNNAGIGMRTVNPSFLTDPKPFYTVSADKFRDLIDTNLTGYFLAAKAFAPMFIQAGKGKIVNISMNHETMKRKGFIPYGPSRAGAESLSYIMAEDLKEHKITVNMLLPGGATETGMIPEELKESFREKGFLLNPDVMADAIVYLASEESDGVTGERIVAKDFIQRQLNSKL